MNKIEPNIAQPLYRQLYDIILKAIDDGVFHPGDKLPSEDKLRQQFNVSRITIRKALQLLAAEEVLVKIHGRGTFIKKGGFLESMSSSGSFTDTCLRMNARPETRIISCSVQQAKQRTADKLGIKAGEHIIQIQRLRLVDGTVCILENDYCPYSMKFLLETTLENVSLFSLIQKNLGIIPERFEDYFEVWYALKNEAALLECKPGTALLRIDQTVSAETAILYYNEQLIRTDRYKYVSTFRFSHRNMTDTV